MEFLRYDSYKPANSPWLLEVPGHWKLLPGLAVLKANKDKNVGMIEETVLSLSYGKVIIKPPEKLTGLVPESFETYQIINPNDIIIRPTDLQNDHTSLRTGFAKDRGIITSAYICLRPDPSHNPAFIHYLLHAYDLLKVFYGMGSGLRQNLDYRDFKRLELCIPPRDEQDRIVSFLDQKTAEIDEAVAKKQRLIDLLKEQKTILINQAVTKGLNSDVAMCDSGVDWIGDIPKHWEVKKLKYYSEVQSGITLGKLYSGNKLVSVPYLRVANVQDGYFKLDEMAELQLPQRVIDQYLVRFGDILVTEGGDIDKLGRGTVWGGEIENCIHQNHIFAVRIKKTVASEYFVSLAMGADYGRKYFTHTANKTTNLASTNQTKLGNFPIALPPLCEQMLLIDYVKDINAKYGVVIATAEEEILNLYELKQIIVAEAVTGKIKL